MPEPTPTRGTAPETDIANRNRPRRKKAAPELTPEQLWMRKKAEALEAQNQTAAAAKSKTNNLAPPPTNPPIGSNRAQRQPRFRCSRRPHRCR
jgi:hypothetical protein